MSFIIIFSPAFQMGEIIWEFNSVMHNVVSAFWLHPDW